MNDDELQEFEQQVASAAASVSRRAARGRYTQILLAYDGSADARAELERVAAVGNPAPAPEDEGDAQERSLQELVRAWTQTQLQVVVANCDRELRECRHEPVRVTVEESRLEIEPDDECGAGKGEHREAGGDQVG